MKLQKIFSGMVASAVAFSIMAVLPASAAETKLASGNRSITGNVTQQSWGMDSGAVVWSDTKEWEIVGAYGAMNVSMTLTNFESTCSLDVTDITLHVYAMGTSNWNWVNGAEGTVESDGTVTFSAPITADLNPNGDAEVQYGVQAYINDGGKDKIAAGDSYSFDVNYTINVNGEVVTDDTWVDNGDGSYTFEYKEANSIPDLLLAGVSGTSGKFLKAKITVENGNANGGFGGNVDSAWANIGTWADSQSFIAPLTGSTEGIHFQTWWFSALDGFKITVSDVAVSDDKNTVTLNDGDKLFWKSAVANGKYNYRAAYVCKLSDLDGKSGVKFSYTTSDKTVSGTATQYYTGIGETATETYTFASDDLVVVSYVLKNIPEDVDVWSFSTELVDIA